MEARGIMGMLNMTNGESLFRLVPTHQILFFPDHVFRISKLFPVGLYSMRTVK
jgi:hypothetical protein